MKDRQIDIRTASFRVVHETPGHVTYGVWVNGGKCGDLVVRQEEDTAFRLMMVRGGFELRELGPMGMPGERPMFDMHSGEAVDQG
jgi:hypothetical protein